ncbi:MAG: HoxN/HupN/NixA family nickel/cobalt transporter, partial [Bacillota bacterium]|nr:HoxN/HupN/NixA family nickel/cobalt transporter [Bacillota bacterium]
IGGVELVQILNEKFGIKEGFLGSINNWNLGWLGYLLVGLFLLSWILSITIWKFMKIEKRWQSNNM